MTSDLPSHHAPLGGVIFLSAHDTRGGTTNYIKTLRQRFEQEGTSCRSVALYSGFIPDPSGFDEVIAPQRKLSAFAYLRAIAGFVSRVRQSGPAVILTVMPMANVAAGLAGWFSKSKVVCTHHSPHDKNGRLVRILDMIMGTLGAYDSIICVSEAVAESYARHPLAYRKRLTVVPNGVPPIHAASDRAETLKRLALPADKPIVFMAGRLAPQKNVLTAVEAIAKVENARLVMSGDGPLKQDLITLAAELGVTDRVHLLGQIDRQDLIDLMFHCDAFMQISIFEGQSMALLEAVYAGALPIVSDIPVQIEVIRLDKERIAGIACDPMDAADVARATNEMLFDVARRREVATNLAALAPNIRTEGQMLDDYWRILRPMLTSGKPTDAAGMSKKGLS